MAVDVLLLGESIPRQANFERLSLFLMILKTEAINKRELLSWQLKELFVLQNVKIQYIYFYFISKITFENETSERT